MITDYAEIVKLAELSNKDENKDELTAEEWADLGRDLGSDIGPVFVRRSDSGRQAV
jgi:hypothetical protein